MDAIKFLKTRNRICKETDDCSNCPIVEFDLCGYDKDVEKIVSIVETWAKEHPLTMRQEEAKSLEICPQCVDIDFKCDPSGDCAKCVCDYWRIER